MDLDKWAETVAAGINIYSANRMARFDALPSALRKCISALDGNPDKAVSIAYDMLNAKKPIKVIIASIEAQTVVASDAECAIANDFLKELGL